MTPIGTLTLLVEGQPVRITGGPFDSLPDGARGLCLEPLSRRAAEAAWRLDIPDFGVPAEDALRGTITTLLAAMRAAPADRFHVGCRAGLGRTGLVLGCLGVAVGAARGDPVAWVRATYHPRAVETAGQEGFLRRFGL